MLIAYSLSSQVRTGEARESARRKQARIEVPLGNRDQPLYPVKARWHYKKEIHGADWYREQMANLKR